MNEDSAALLGKAQRSLEATALLLAEGHVDFAASRAYYAVFYIAEALLADLDLRFTSHGAVHGAYGKEFAKTDILDPRFHRLLLDSFDRRQIAVYEVEAELRPDDVRETLSGAQVFLAAARTHVEGAR